MANNLEGRVALVTGGSNGIGQAICARLAAGGADVAILDAADASQTLQMIAKSERSALARRCDITDPAAVNSAIESLTTELGAIDILVHSAGIYPMRSFDEMTFEEWRKVLSVNLDSMFHLLKGVLPGMKAQKWGRVISIASNTFHAGAPMLSHYVASKGGLIGLTRSLAAELGEHGITMNAIAPTLVRTKTTESTLQPQFFEFISQLQAIKRTSVPDDYTGTVAFLASEDARFITGQTLVVDGGWVRS